jgi:hypothetical protein
MTAASKAAISAAEPTVIRLRVGQSGQERPMAFFSLAKAAWTSLAGFFQSRRRRTGSAPCRCCAGNSRGW